MLTPLLEAVNVSCPAPVSVIVPAYNERECIADTLASLLASDHPIDIVVVDDGSTDGAADIAAAVRDPRVRVIRQPGRALRPWATRSCRSSSGARNRSARWKR